jgi:NDP-sugar pyrophosphorylase family protein
MKAMIFAAGLGTRLRPLTDHTPKALVEIGGKSLLEHNILKLKHFGYTQLIINVHYLGYKVIDFLQQRNNFGLDITISDESDKILDTGGGLKKAGSYLQGKKSFLVCNVDILSNLDLKALRDFHEKENALATLAIRQRETSRYLLFDKNMQLSGWKNKKTGESIITQNSENELFEYAFSGVQMIHPRIFEQIEEEGVFSTIPMYLRLSRQEKIVGFRHNEGHWIDVGKFEHFKKAEDTLRKTDKE